MDSGDIPSLPRRVWCHQPGPDHFHNFHKELFSSVFPTFPPKLSHLFRAVTFNPIPCSVYFQRGKYLCKYLCKYDARKEAATGREPELGEIFRWGLDV